MSYEMNKKLYKNNDNEKIIHDSLKEALKNVEKYKELYKQLSDFNISLERQIENSDESNKALKNTIKEQKILIDNLQSKIDEQDKNIEEQGVIIKMLNSDIEEKQMCIDSLNFQLSERKEELDELKAAEYFKQLSIDKKSNCLKIELENILENESENELKSEFKNNNKKQCNEILKIAKIDEINFDEVDLEFDNLDICIQPLFSSSKIIAEPKSSNCQKWIVHFSERKASYVIWNDSTILLEGVVSPETKISVEHHQLLIFDAIFKKKIKFDYECTISIISNSNVKNIYEADYQVYYKRNLPLAKYINFKLKNFKFLEFNILLADNIDNIFNYCIELEKKI